MFQNAQFIKHKSLAQGKHTATLWSHDGDYSIWQPIITQFYFLNKVLNSSNIEYTIPIKKLSWARFLTIHWRKKGVHILASNQIHSLFSLINPKLQRITVYYNYLSLIQTVNHAKHIIISLPFSPYTLLRQLSLEIRIKRYNLKFSFPFLATKEKNSKKTNITSNFQSKKHKSFRFKF